MTSDRTGHASSAASPVSSVPINDSHEQRVLVLAPGSADMDAASLMLAAAGIASVECGSLGEIARELREHGAAAVMLPDRSIDSEELQELTEALRYQPAWSDLPILLLASSGAESPVVGRFVALLGNVTVLELPLRSATVVSAARTAVRARQRQYALRDQMEALRESEERFELAAQATHDAIWDLDCTVADAAERVFKRSGFGWDAGDEPALEAWVERIHPEDRDRAVQSLRHAIDGTAPLWTEEYRFRDANGSYIYIDDRGQILRDSSGRALRAVGAMMDITARKRAEEAMALNAAIVASSDDAIISKTLDGVIRSWNAGAERLFGHTAAEAVGQPISLIIPASKLAEEAQILSRLGRGERIDHFETVRLAKDGHEVNISLTVSPVRDAVGRVLGASKVARDISSRKRVELELVRQDAQLRLLWETAAVLLTSEKPDAMLRGVFNKIAPYLRLDAYLNYVVDETGEGLRLESSAGIREAEAAALQRLAPGQNVCGSVASERRPITASHIQRSADESLAWARRLGFRAYAGNPLIADGRLLGTLAFATRAKDEFDPDEIEFLETMCRYVTAAYERMHLIRQLRETDNKKDEFLATLAHELRNPLAPIRNALEIMRVDGHQSSAVEQAARQMIERQLEQMVRLIDDLLDVSRITRGRLELRKERVELAHVVRSAVDTSRPLVDAARHELTVELPHEPIYLDADPVRLAQVIANLLNNAARYTEPGGNIWLTARDDGGEIEIVVRDTGVGIPADALPWIFDMFAQVDESLERSQSGLGIGLTLVKRLVEMHGGTVVARSEGTGRGAEFTVRLPRASASAVAETHVAQLEIGPPPPHSVVHRVLVADDNRDAAESMGMLLRLMGNEVRTVHDGIKAVEEAATFHPDVILLDIGMPRLNGYDAARLIREQGWSNGTMIVALTGWGQEEDKRRATEAGFDRHFTKPLDPAELQKLINEFRPD
jgi:PAS domain S-box-containing protein